MERNILRTKNHWIVCGYGRMGRVICKQLRREKIPIVVLEKKPEAVEELIQKNIMYISDDATSSDTLLQARIMQAQGLITAVGSDSENVYICLTGRGYNPDLFIISRAMTDEGAVRLFWAGANKVFSPYTVGGLQIANTITRPNVSEFFELVMSKGGEEKDIQIDEISIGSKSPLKGQKIGETNLVKTNMLVIGLKTANAVFSYNPPRSTVLHEGDCLIVLGRRGDYLKFIKEMGQITA